MKPHCLFTAPYDFLPADLLDEYRAVMPTTFQEVWRREELIPDAAVTVWVMNPGQHFVIDDDALNDFPGIQVVSTPSTGRNHIDIAACERRGVTVYALLDNRPVLETITASPEFTFLLLLNSLRRLDRGLTEVTTGRWRAREDALRGAELAGKLVGLIGLGRIGRRMARYCAAFDAKVVYYDPYVAGSEIPAWSIERIFAEADAVCVCCTLTPETAGMIDATLLRRLKPHATIVNTARGEVIVEEHLASLLAERDDLRVAVDVLAGEVRGTHYDSPLMPFFRSGQLTITPHMAGVAVEAQTKAARGALELIRQHFAELAAPRV